MEWFEWDDVRAFFCDEHAPAFREGGFIDFLEAGCAVLVSKIYINSFSYFIIKRGLKVNTINFKRYLS